MSATNGRPRPAGLSELDDLREAAEAERYLRRQREMRRGRNRADGPHPREYDENGFPIPQTGRSFVSRVAQLLDIRKSN